MSAPPRIPAAPARRTFLRIAAGSAVLLPIAALAGCSGPARDPGTIRVAYQQFGSGTEMETMLRRVSESYTAQNPSVTIELVPIVAAENDYFTKNELLMASPRTSPDVVYEDSFILLSDVGAGYLRSIDEEVSAWAPWTEIAPASQDAFTGEDGRIYGIPVSTDTRALWYHRGVFAEAGLPDPWEPRSWEDVLEAARTIRDSSTQAAPLFVFSGKAQGEKASMQGFEMLLYGTGSTLYDEDARTWVTGSQGFEDSLAFLRTLFAEELTLTLSQHLDPNISESIYSTLLPEGRLGILLDGSWISRNWAEGAPAAWPEWTETIALAKMPTQHGQDPGSVTLAGGWGWTIPQHASDKQAAFDFIQALCERENSVLRAIEDNHITVRADVAADERYLSYSPTVSFFTELLETARYRPALPAYPEVSAAIQEAMEVVMTGTADPARAAAAYDAQVAEIVGAENVQEEAR
ncbi:extracellular solute-binding protein [Brachybacterium hainanense]|uniref:Extracellular solute-binding protein n=1 Tax=Brachybacterium hainanense TaxID=1541174 RepID=A0ABV6RFV0_9MICO